ncbi:MAG: glycosyltransferase, partial [Clostridia bacterium]|nr:glycosyltransferase [Clostridia bacterium]
MSKFKSFISKMYHNQVIRYLFVGVLNTAVGYGVGAGFTALFRWCGLNVDLSNLLGGLIGTIVGVIHSYFWNKYFTFQSKKKSFSEVIRFVIVYAVQYGVTQLLNWGFSHVIDNHWIYQFISTCITTVISWFGHKYFSFRKNKEKAEVKQTLCALAQFDGEGKAIMRKISFLIPCYNEEGNVKPLSEAITEQVKNLSTQYDYEIVYIDNCSSDKTREILEEMCAADKHIKAIFNARNYGQFNSPYYGVLQCHGDCVITMCADFQDPPEMIPDLVAEWEKGYKVVCAVKNKSAENKLVRLFRTIYYKMIRKHSEVDLIEHFTGTGLYDKEFVDVLRGLDEPAPYMRGLVAELGFKMTTVKYKQAKRRSGKTSNNFGRLYDAAWQSFTQYTKFPFRFIMTIGIMLFILSVGGITCSVVFGILGKDVLIYALISCMCFLASLTFIFMSILGEYILNLKTKVNHRPLVVEE